MPKVLDKDRVQRALDEAARKARRGEAGSGKFLLGRNASTGRLVGAGNERPKIGGGRKRKQPEE